jgi:hypothetical protein
MDHMRSPLNIAVRSRASQPLLSSLNRSSKQGSSIIDVSYPFPTLMGLGYLSTLIFGV